MLPETHNDSFFFSDNRKIVVFEQNKKKYIGNNRKEKYFCCYKPDIKFTETACDYLLINKDENNAYFIELKGSDVIKAVLQIKNSIELYKDYLSNFIKHARIVPSRVNTHDLSSLELRRLKSSIEKSGGTFKKQTKILEEDI